MTAYPTSIGTADETSITVLGQDLADDLMGQVGFAELAFWLVAMRRPTPGELRVFETVLVVTGRPRAHPDGARRTAHAHGSTGVGAGRAGRRTARWGIAVPRRHRGLRPVPRRHPGRGARVRTRAAHVRRRSGTRSRSRRSGRSGPRGCWCRGSGTPCTRTATPGRRCSSRSPGRRVSSARTCSCSRRWDACTRRCSAARCR